MYFLSNDYTVFFSSINLYYYNQLYGFFSANTLLSFYKHKYFIKIFRLWTGKWMAVLISGIDVKKIL